MPSAKRDIGRGGSNACFVDGKVVPACEVWTIHNMSSDQGTDVDIPINSNNITDEPALECTVNELADSSQLYNVNAYVAAIYERKWYIGQILEYDGDDQNITSHLW